MPAPKKKKPVTSPPPGSYDPAIDAQVGQTNRGLADLLSDYVRDFGEPGTALGGRSGEDYGLGVANVEQGYSRGIMDLLRNRGRGREDYDLNIAGLDRSFAQQGAAQTQTARASGTARGGVLAQAMAKRAANKAIARQPIDASFNRFTADSALAEGRLGEDRGTALTGLGTSLLRGTEDAATQLSRAQRENAQFGLDATTQRFFQANLPLNAAEEPAAPTVPRRRRKPVVPRPTNGRRIG